VGEHHRPQHHAGLPTPGPSGDQPEQSGQDQRAD
jgi:hypothetical protein